MTNILLNTTRTVIPNFKLFLNRNYKSSSFYIKFLDRFQDNVRFSICKHILNLKDKSHFPVFEYNPQFNKKLTFITYKIIIENKNYLMKTKLTSELFLESKFPHFIR